MEGKGFFGIFFSSTAAGDVETSRRVISWTRRDAFRDFCCSTLAAACAQLDVCALDALSASLLSRDMRLHVALLLSILDAARPRTASQALALHRRRAATDAVTDAATLASADGRRARRALRRGGGARAPTPDVVARTAALRRRGGSIEEDDEDEDEDAETAVAAPIDSDAAARRAWLLEQIKRRQDRVAVYSKALAERGLPFGDGSTAAPPVRGVIEMPDWLVARATDEKPMPCLIWGDAAEDCAVVRPRKAGGQWVSLSALNALRRTEPVKASKLWYRDRAGSLLVGAATWIVRGRVAAAPRLPRGSSVDGPPRRRGGRAVAELGRRSASCTSSR